MGAMNKRWASMWVGLGLVALGAPALAANVVTNGDFATGDLTGWTAFQTASGTTGSGLPTVVSFNTTGAGDSNSAKFNVGGAAASTNGTPQGGGISQVVNVTGGSYVFNAYFASLNDADGQVNSDAGTFTLLVDGHAAESVTLGGFDFPYQELTGSLADTIALSAGAHTIGLEIARNYISNGDLTPTEYLTDISLASAVSAVPEPDASVLMLMGMTALSAAAARRARKG